ncbi:MAG: 50S ribosomal protein L9 [Patescibacteria group bacterium]
MKIILLKDVPKVGQKYDIKNVPDGYALNFLIPQKLAVLATAGKLAEVEQLKKGMVVQKEQEESELLKSLKALSGLELIIKAKASDKGHLFSKISKKDIIGKMKKDYNIEINEDYIVLDEPIKEIGEFEILVEVKDKKTKFKLLIERID